MTHCVEKPTNTELGLLNFDDGEDYKITSEN